MMVWKQETLIPLETIHQSPIISLIQPPLCTALARTTAYTNLHCFIVAKTVVKLREGEMDIETVCLSCGDQSTREQLQAHPLFTGGICEDCLVSSVLTGRSCNISWLIAILKK